MSLHCSTLQHVLAAILVSIPAMYAMPAQAETFRVSINKLDYTPAEVKAKVGDTIEFINQDVLAHTATVRGDWDVMIPAKKSASVVIRRAGDVEYYCRFHPNMKGRISVSAN
ncbi:MAG: cupredoxin domain-containing protein [Pseudomonadota bacterium]|jgi:plastocyanin